MMMVSDDCLVECKIDDDSDEDDGGGEQMSTPPPPPEFASKSPTPTPPPPTPPTPPAAPVTPTPTRPVSRDPYGINKHLQVEVSDVLAEPATPRSIDQVWFYSVTGFEKARTWTYCCLTLLLAVPFAFLCGVFLAILACLHVWFLVPCIQLSNTFLPCLRSLCICSVNVFISPLSLKKKLQNVQRSPCESTAGDPPQDSLCEQTGCHGLLRPAVVWFGEQLDSDVLTRAEKVLDSCDLCLVVGTSSIVNPAGKLAPKVAARGVPVAEFNMEHTKATMRFKFHFHGPCGSTLPAELARHETETH